MAKHTLFVLKPGFYDGEQGPYYCPHSATIEGMLTYLPEIVDKVEIHRIAYPRPRASVIELIGEENQGSPVLVLAAGSEVPASATVYEKTGRAFIHDTFEIGQYLSNDLDVMPPH